MITVNGKDLHEENGTKIDGNITPYIDNRGQERCSNCHFLIDNDGSAWLGEDDNCTGASEVYKYCEECGGYAVILEHE